MIEAIRDGASLHAIPTSGNPFAEQTPLREGPIHLPHILVSDKIFYSITAPGLFQNCQNRQAAISRYFTNQFNLTGAFCPLEMFRRADNQLPVSFETEQPYPPHFQYRVKYDLIWDSNGEMDIDCLRRAVTHPRKLTIAFLDSENIWNIHPVALPQINRDTESFVLKTEYIIYPYLFRNPTHMDRFMKESILNSLDGGSMQVSSGQATEEVQPFIAFYHIQQDNTYRSYYDLRRGNTQNTYKSLKIFAEAQEI